MNGTFGVEDSEGCIRTLYINQGPCSKEVRKVHRREADLLEGTKMENSTVKGRTSLYRNKRIETENHLDWNK